jgi:hypothetical protein
MRSLAGSGPWPHWAAALRSSPHLRATVPAAALGWAALAQLALIAGFAAPLCLGGNVLIAPIHLAAFRGAVAGHWPELAAHAAAMAAIMTVPATNAPLGHVLRSSFPERAARHGALFLLAFAGLWTALALLMALAVLASALLAPQLGLPIAAAALLAAAAWQLAPARRRALGRCHGTVPVYPDGAAGLSSSAGYGLRVGAACAAACGPLMFAAMLSPLPLPAMAAAAALAALERQGRPAAAALHARLIAAAALLLLLLDFGIGLS